MVNFTAHEMAAEALRASQLKKIQPELKAHGWYFFNLSL